MCASRRRSGLSRVETVIVLAVMGLLLTVCLPMLVSGRESARRQQCAQHLQQLGLALHSYHSAHRSLPPAAIWAPGPFRSLALHEARRVDLVTHGNWARMLLPHAGHEDLAHQFRADFPVGADENAQARSTKLPLMNCPSDEDNRSDNPYVFSPREGVSISFARGNYAINGGTHCFKTGPGSTAALTGDAAHLAIDDEQREFRFWGNGVAGFNVAFSIDDFSNGTSTLVALEEVRAGIHPVDLRGTWSLGQVGASVTWGHGVNSDDFAPNRQWPRADDIRDCRKLHELLGSDTLMREGMPCVSYVDANQNATARSRHSGGVNVLFLDGAVRFISDDVDPGLWHVMHSRETPAELLEKFEERLAATPPEDAAPPDTRCLQRPGAVPLSLMRNSIGMEFVLLPAGAFTMGVPDLSNDFELPDESPPHPVRLTAPFYLGRCEATQAQYEQVMNGNPSFHQSGEDRFTGHYPVEQVSWHEAVEFCRRLSNFPEERAAGRRYRLPTEAEWEYACRCGSSEPYAWVPRRAKTDKSGEAAGIDPPLPVAGVGSYAASVFGLYDMRGNVWEWCADWFDRGYYSRSPVEDPQGPALGYLKVVRGGDWRYVGEPCKIDYSMLPPWKRSPFVGFRVVCELVAPVEDAGLPSPPQTAYDPNRRLGRGINLGNALDAPREGAWGLTLHEEHLQEIAETGFDSVRVPVRWSAHAQLDAPFTIDPAFFERVDWAVRQALGRGLKVVLNVHHYDELNLDPEGERRRFLALWSQIAERYRDQSDALYFEVLNEPHAGLSAEKWNALLADALSVIRRSNPDRFVIVGPAEFNTISRLPALRLPEQDRRLIVTFHYYSPLQFTHQGASWTKGSDEWLGTTWDGTPGQKQAVRRDLDHAALWAEERDRPLFLGEFGAYSRADMASRVRWTRFVRDEAEKRGMSWSYWEFGTGYGAYDPSIRRWRLPLREALIPLSVESPTVTYAKALSAASAGKRR